MPKPSPFLWFNDEAEDAAKFYTSVFPNSRITNVARHGSAGPGPEGTVMAVSFELDGEPFTALNGGPVHAGFTETISFLINLDTQEEVDRYWAELSAGGEEGPCGWLKDKFGLSWQVIPNRLTELLGSSDGEAAQRAMSAMLLMQKIVIDDLEKAAAGV